ncbi:hypothetical protein LPB87_01345 [Flavobacterium sp. EDS]|nr:hypothetical protein [Flavobacterium sp. EDS]MCD0473032.1 hypothetical protein [Flavobacterium sp. EDS]
MAQCLLTSHPQSKAIKQELLSMNFLRNYLCVPSTSLRMTDEKITA